MLDTYIKNKGITKTIIHNNNNTQVNEMYWDTDYDGRQANISLDVNSNGKLQHYEVELNNQDLANILNIPTVDIPLEKRLTRDFKKTNKFNEAPLMIEFDSPPLVPLEPSYSKLDKPFYTHISSPLKNEEIIIPLTIDKKTSQPNYFTKKSHRKHSKKSHKIYRHIKSSHSKDKTYKSKHKKSSRRISRRTI